MEYAFEDMETINNALKSADELLANEPEVGRIDYSDRSEDINVIYETFKGCYTYIVIIQSHAYFSSKNTYVACSPNNFKSG